MIAIHQHFRFDDGNQSGFLAQRRVAGQRVRVGLEATTGGKSLADGEHRAPFGETCAHLGIFRETFAQSVQTFGDFLSGMTGQILCAGIHFDARNDPGIGENTGKKNTVSILLADGLVIENCATDIPAKPGRGHNQLPIDAPGFHRLRNTEFGKSLVAGGIAFVHRQQPFVVGDQRFCGVH